MFTAVQLEHNETRKTKNNHCCFFSREGEAFFSLTLFTLLLQRLLNQNKHPAGYITRKEKRELFSSLQ